MDQWDYKVIRVKVTWMPDQFVNTPHERSSNVEKLLDDLGDYGDSLVSVTAIGDGSAVLIVTRRPRA